MAIAPYKASSFFICGNLKTLLPHIQYHVSRNNKCSIFQSLFLSTNTHNWIFECLCIAPRELTYVGHLHFEHTKVKTDVRALSILLCFVSQSCARLFLYWLVLFVLLVLLLLFLLFPLFLLFLLSALFVVCVVCVVCVKPTENCCKYVRWFQNKKTKVAH